MAGYLGWWAILLACLGTACSSAPAAHSARTSLPLTEIHRGPATDYVAAAGLRWMVVGRPKWLCQNPVTRSELERLFLPERLEAFEQATGIDLREVPEALVAGFERATLYLVLMPGSTALVEQRFRERLASQPMERRLDPRVRLVSGRVGGERQTLVTLETLGVAVAVGDPTPAHAAAAYALGRLAGSPSALQGAALRDLPRTLDHAPLRFYAPGPFQNEWESAAGGLLGSATAVAVAAEPRDRVLRVELLVAGQWHDTALARELLGRVWHQVADSHLGHLTGLNQPREGPELRSTPSELSLRVALDLRTLTTGLEAVVSAEASKMLGLGSEQQRQ